MAGESKKLGNSRPKELTTLHLVEGSGGGSVQYLIEHPPKGGPQALLRVEKKSAAPDLVFRDALTVLPTGYRGRGSQPIITDDFLLTAFAIVSAEYSEKIDQYTRDPVFMATIPRSLRQLPYRRAGDRSVSARVTAHIGALRGDR